MVTIGASGDGRSATAASTMLAIGATMSASRPETNYSNSRRRNSSTLMAEISANAASAVAVNSTRA